MKDKEFTKELNLKCAFKRKPESDLKSALKLHNKRQLESTYFAITKEDIEESKQKLINKIYEELTKEEVFVRLLNTLIENEYQLLTKIIKNDGILKDNYIKYVDYRYLSELGIIYLFNFENNLHIIIPKEIMDIIKKIDINNYQDKVSENTKLFDLCRSMINLYGVVPFTRYLEACSKYYNCENIKDIDLDCIFVQDRQFSIEIVKTDNDIYMVKDEYLNEEDDTQKTIISKIISKLEDDLFYMDFKEITLEELLKYKEMYDYVETKAITKFNEYIKEKNIYIEDFDLLMGAIVTTFRKDYNEGILFLNDMFEEEGFNIDENNIDEILEYINDIVNEIPVWGNKGWTNKEIILRKCYE